MKPRNPRKCSRQVCSSVRSKVVRPVLYARSGFFTNPVHSYTCCDASQPVFEWTGFKFVKLGMPIREYLARAYEKTFFHPKSIVSSAVSPISAHDRNSAPWAPKAFELCVWGVYVHASEGDSSIISTQTHFLVMNCVSECIVPPTSGWLFAA